MIKKSILIILALILLVTLIGCSSKQKEIDALKARVEELEKELEVKVPQYKIDGKHLYDCFITITSSCTEEDMADICRKEGLGNVNVYFFLPNAPRKKYEYHDKKLPDKDYCVAVLKKKDGKWKKS